MGAAAMYTTADGRAAARRQGKVAARKWSSGRKEMAVPACWSAQWEGLLRELGLDEAGALRALNARPWDEMAARIQSWVRLHRTGSFVPEAVLLALGLRVDWDEVSTSRLARGSSVAWRRGGALRETLAEVGTEQ